VAASLSFKQELLMRIASQAALLLLIGVALIGCGDAGGQQGTLDPNLPVVSIKVAGMTWPSGWPPRARKALATLPWVEQDSIIVDVSKRMVRFNVKDKSQFDLEQIDAAVKKQKFGGCELISGPEILAKKAEEI
jgi:hypothetical protein